MRSASRPTLENLIECIQAADERSQPPERMGLDAVAGARSVDVAADEPSVFKHLQVLRHRRLREIKAVDDFPADAALAANKQAQDLDPRRMNCGSNELAAVLVALN